MENELFQVGQTLFVQASYKTHLTTQILGWEKDAFLLTRAIYYQGLPAKIKTNDQCKIRFLKDGTAYGFETDVVAVQFFPYPLMYLKYPVNIETMKLRVAPRFKTSLPARLLYATGTFIADAIILDISEGGCGINFPVQEGWELLPEVAHLMTFKLLDREVTIGCHVRKMIRGTDQYFLGMEFTNITQQNQETLNLFLDFLKHHIGE